MKYNHGEHCEGSICQDDNNPDWYNETLWCPGEKVCTKEPSMKFQKKQLAINREMKNGTFRNTETAYSAEELENKSI